MEKAKYFRKLCKSCGGFITSKDDGIDVIENNYEGDEWWYHKICYDNMKECSILHIDKEKLLKNPNGQ